MKKLIIAACALTATLSATAQTEVMTGVTNGKEYGVAYSLPKTEIEVTAKVSHVVYTPGEFAKYADKYLRMNKVPQEAEEHYELLSVEAASVGAPDKDNVYFVKMKNNTVAPLLELTNDGIIKSINMPKSTADGGNGKSVEPVKSRTPDPRSFLTEEILMSSSSAKMAELVAKEIYSIRESKNALLRGQADNMPKDGEQLKIMIESLNEQEQAMTEMFTGKYEREEKTHSVRVQPMDLKNAVVAMRFSKKLGVISKDDLAGEPIYLSIKDLKSVNQPEETKKKLEGVAYNVPGKALVTLTMNQKKMYEKELPVTQFGVIEYLAPVLFNKAATLKVSFDPNTGALLKIDRDEVK